VQPRVEFLRVDDVAVGQGDDVVLVDDVLKNVRMEKTETGVERTVGDIECLAVERTFIARDRREHTAACVLKFPDEFGKIGWRCGLRRGVGIEADDFAHACAVGRSAAPEKDGQDWPKEKRGVFSMETGRTRQRGERGRLN